jgi:hypothetical protein
MADTVDTIAIFKGKRTAAYRLLGISDGTGESLVTKIDLSTLTKSDGAAPTRCSILAIKWDVQGYSSVRLYWDHTTPDECMVMSKVGYIDYRELGGLVDPASAGGTGNLKLTSADPVSGATYDITVEIGLLG